MKAINNALIRSFYPCYDPSKINIPDNEILPVLDWVEKYRGVVPAKDIVWLLCHNEFLSDKDLRLFAVWCAREALKLVENPDARSIEACNVAERFANGDATMEELAASARNAKAAESASETSAAAWAARAVVSAAEGAVERSVSEAREACEASEEQLNKLLNYFK